MFLGSGVALVDGCDDVSCIPNPRGLLRGILSEEHVCREWRGFDRRM